MNTAHSDRALGGDLGGDLGRDPRGDYGQNGMLGFNATGPTH